MTLWAQSIFRQNQLKMINGNFELLRRKYPWYTYMFTLALEIVLLLSSCVY